MRRFTKAEWEAISYALGNALAGVLDGVDEDSPEYEAMWANLTSAQAKVWERL